MTPEIKKKIEDEADKYGFVVPYDGSNNFYKPNAVEGFIAGAEWWHSLMQEEVDNWKVDKEFWHKKASDQNETIESQAKEIEALKAEKKDAYSAGLMAERILWRSEIEKICRMY